jgi:hypothetical protein
MEQVTGSFGSGENFMTKSFIVFPDGENKGRPCGIKK